MNPLVRKLKDRFKRRQEPENDTKRQESRLLKPFLQFNFYVLERTKMKQLNNISFYLHSY
jgi:hypothetical protein